MRNYEVSFIVDPVLSGDEIKATAQTYVDHLTSEGCKIVHVNEMGLRQLAYPINRRTTGVYYCVEFECETGALISKMELAFRRDERIMRFLTVKLDKYGVKYNDDKRNGLIGTVKKKKDREEKKDSRGRSSGPAKKVEKKTEKVEKAAPVAAAATTAPVAETKAPAVEKVAAGADTLVSNTIVSEEE